MSQRITDDILGFEFDFLGKKTSLAHYLLSTDIQTKATKEDSLLKYHQSAKLNETYSL
ncbi:hypothetical protein [Nostoc sp. C057]|uniref:hypothetical protein n=1 Tax=Nostoc sp. C057 TaxID=2576903 RepID=UPI0015C31585|nr:hypothetical protein [Nostoc sp. C057]